MTKTIKENKFTKEEWVVNKAFASTPTWHICKKTDAPAGVIASVYNEEAAKLIAAAPELLKALQELHHYTHAHKELSGFIKFEHLSNQAKAAIKKATD